MKSNEVLELMKEIDDFLESRPRINNQTEVRIAALEGLAHTLRTKLLTEAFFVGMKNQIEKMLK